VNTGGTVGRAHQVQQVTIVVTRVGDGYLLACPALPGWEQHVTGPQALVRGIHTAFTEHECANYSRWRGVPYDAASFATDAFEDPGLAVQVPDEDRRHPAEPPVTTVPRIGWHKESQVRPDTHDPAAWTPLPDGRWRSPTGRHYRGTTAMVASVVARRQQLGLPVSASA
jgi:hypothetical protein